MTYFGPKNALAKYIWKVLKNRSNEICIRQGSPVITIFKRNWLKTPQVCVESAIVSLLSKMASQRLHIEGHKGG